MPLAGFICPLTDKPVYFEKDCLSCKNKCNPSPVLAMLIKSRQVKPKVYSVTEILKPLQSIYLSRNNPYFIPPDALIFASLGTAWHEKIEKTLNEDEQTLFSSSYIWEEPFEVAFVGLAKLVGRPDLYNTKKKILWDFKTSAFYYTGKYLIEGKWEDSNYKWQLNI